MVNTQDMVASTSSKLRTSYGERLRRRLPAGLLLLLLPSLLSCASLQYTKQPQTYGKFVGNICSSAAQQKQLCKHTLRLAPCCS
jgi:hypothetical protein